ncbi:MAG: SdrD B-like domain-containing protein, partial [Chloroflexota bacterium]
AAVCLTDANGNYTLTVGADYPLRLEMTGLPNYLQPGSNGTDSETSVTFVSADSAGIDFGVNNPVDYCQSNPLVVTTCFVSGEYNGLNAGETALVSFPYTSTGHHFSGITPTASFLGSTEATIGQIGAVNGIAWQRTTGLLYVGAYQKRFTGYGPGGPDAIYIIDPATDSVVDTIELDTLLGGVDTAGSDPHDLTTVTANGTDFASADEVGKISWGDLDISADMNTLYAVNLADRKIYAIDISAGTSAGAAVLQSWDTPDACGVSEHRPFALELKDDVLWVGSVCEDISGAHIHSFTPNVSTSSPTMNLEITAPLTYTREAVFGGQNTANNRANWLAWESFSTITISGESTPVTNSEEIWAPQPMLTDIDFDNESLILGFRDRFGDQSGSGTKPRDGFSDLVWGDSAGDILRVCSVNGAFVVEGGVGCTPGGLNPTAGPGGAEYYYWEFFSLNATKDPDPANSNGFHWELAQGGLLQLPGHETIMTTAMDPYDDFSGGILRLVNETGKREGVDGVGDCINTGGDGSDGCDTDFIGGYTLYESGDYAGAPPETDLFAKANGLGDLDALCYLAPIEIGNRVWEDSDGDGIQDPSESGINGIVVELYDSSGTLVVTATTDSSGNYYFIDNSHPLSSTVGGEYGVATTISPNSEYEIRIDMEQAALNDYALTVPNSSGDSSNSNLTDLSDSDGIHDFLNDDAVVAITTGAAGSNNHTLDFGFNQGVRVGNRVWYDANNNGIIDGSESNYGIDGVTVELLDNGGSVISTTITADGGFYLFTHDNGGNLLLDGNYSVRIPADGNMGTGTSNTPLKDYQSSVDAGNEANPNSDIDNDDNGIGTTSGVTVTSGVVTLDAYTEVTTTTDT